VAFANNISKFACFEPRIFAGCYMNKSNDAFAKGL